MNKFKTSFYFLILIISLPIYSFPVVEIDTTTLLYFLDSNLKPESICLYKGTNTKVECKGVKKEEAICMVTGRNNRLKCTGVKLPQAICMLGGARGKSSCENVKKIEEAICLSAAVNNKSNCKNVSKAEAICLAGGRGLDVCRGADMTQALCMANSIASKTSCSL